MITRLTRRRVRIADPTKTSRKPETREKNGLAGVQSTGPSSKWSLPAEAYGFGYLLTGTTLAVLGQLVTNQGATDPSTQLIAWTKYLCTFVLSLTIQLLSSRPVPGSDGRSQAAAPPPPGSPGPAAAAIAGAAAAPDAAAAGVEDSDRNSRRTAAWLTGAIGLLDTLSYGLNCLGFALCGSALSMVVFAASGQVFTALTRRLLLRKGMAAGQSAGVGLVVVGLIVRSEKKIRDALATTSAAAAAMTAVPGGGGDETATVTKAVAGAGLDRDMALGVALVVLSAFGYSLLGCLYEWLSAVRGPAMSHAQVASSTALIGLLASSAYQLLYTRPRWQELVSERMAQRGLGWWPVVRLYGVFGALFTAHGLVQGMVLQRSGATTVGIISALRASAVAVASGVLFCHPEAPQQCLTPASAASAGIVTLGALLWTLTGPPRPPPPSSPPSALSPPQPPATGAEAWGLGSRESGRPAEDVPLDHKHGKHH